MAENSYKKKLEIGRNSQKNFMRGNLSRGNFLAGNFPGGNFPCG